MQRLHTLVYCSRNRIAGDHAQVTQELEKILASSRTNNVKAGISGALIYNAGSFAQVLEGPLEAIERTFEIIQRDPRHTEVTVIHAGQLEQRQYPDWSMAFTGVVEHGGLPVATKAIEAVFANSSNAGEQMLSTIKDMIVSEDEWVLLDAA